MPQFQHDRQFNYDRAVDGCKQLLWGFVKKIVIADRCAIIVDFYWNQYQDLPGLTLINRTFNYNWTDATVYYRINALTATLLWSGTSLTYNAASQAPTC